MILEVKPAAKLIRPRISGTPSTAQVKNYNNALKEYIQNTLKYAAAKKWCAQRGIIYKIITDKELDKVSF